MVERGETLDLVARLGSMMKAPSRLPAAEPLPADL